MERWKIYAFAAAIFAGLTSVVAKAGLKNVSADLGLAIRSIFVCALVCVNLMIWSNSGSIAPALRATGARTIWLLALSALTTTLSWVCYYRAMKEGTVSFVSLVDKGSILITILLSVLVLSEAFTWRIAIGAGLICGGLFVLGGGK